MIKKKEIEKYIELPANRRVDYLFSLVETNDNKPLGISSEYLLSLLQWEEDPLAKWHIIKALGIIKDERAVDYLITVLLEKNTQFENTSLHHIAASSLGQIGSAALKQIVNALVENQDKIEHRIALVDAIGQIADPNSNLILKELYLSSPFEVKQIITLAFSKIGDSTIPIIKELYHKSSKTTEHILLLDSLIKLGSTKAYQLMKSFLLNWNREEVMYVLESRIDFNNPVGYEILNSLTSHSDLEIKNKSLEKIKSLKKS